MNSRNNRGSAVVGVTEFNGAFNVWVTTNVNGAWHTHNTSQRFSTQQEARAEALHQSNEFQNRGWSVRVDASAR